MPARPSVTPGANPTRLRSLARLPEHKIHWVTLIGRNFHSRARAHFIERTPRKRAIIRIRRDVEENMPFGYIGMAARDKTLHDRDHLGDVIRSARLNARR